MCVCIEIMWKILLCYQMRHTQQRIITKYRRKGKFFSRLATGKSMIHCHTHKFIRILFFCAHSDVAQSIRIVTCDCVLFSLLALAVLLWKWQQEKKNWFNRQTELAFSHIPASFIFVRVFLSFKIYFSHKNI